MTRCPACAGPSAAQFLVRDPVPVHQNLVVRDIDAARALRRGVLALHACAACGFVFNAAFDPTLLSYGAAYDNTQSCSPAFEAYVDDLAAHLVGERGVRGSRIVEIGCGKGGFLRALVQRDRGNTGLGFDPSYVGPDTDVDGRVRFERRFFDESSADADADAVVCRHVIEHIPDPLALLRLIRRTLADRPARVFFETPCVEWILTHGVIWDFFYEHCSYFSAPSLAFAFERAGFAVDAVRHTFGGQYLWLEARPAEPAARPPADGGRIAQLARRFAEGEAEQCHALARQVDTLRRDGPVALWGAAAKGVTLANLVDPECTRFACVVDVNPNKQGARLPGTGHAIVGPHELASRGVRTAIVTNPNYLGENARLLSEAGLPVRLVDLMSEPEIDAHRR